MFLHSQSASTNTNRNVSFPASVGGLNAHSSVMSMPAADATVMENFFPYPDRLETRPGYVSHVTGFDAIPYRMFTYAAGSGGEQLFAATNAGIYDVTSAGARGAAVATITNGKVDSTVMSTGAVTVLMVVNGTDNLKKYDGTTWTDVAAFGAQNTNTFSCVETYRQRLFFAERNSLNLWFLPINSVSGTATSYALGAIFRQGGYITDIATWTIDGGYGPEDQLVVCTSKGEIAVVSGADPSSAASWALRGVYYIGKPLGASPLFKYGGDLLFLSENGLYPLSTAVQAAAIERTTSVTDKIRQLFNDAATQYAGNEGWQIIAQPNVPFLLVNIPASPVRQQFVMHAQTGAWSKFTGWDAYCFARMGATLYFATSTGIKRVTGPSDAGGNITATLVSSFQRAGSPRTKQFVEIKPYFTTSGNFTYSLGVVSDFKDIIEASNIAKTTLGNASLWGSAIWGTAVWGGSAVDLQEWQTPPDDFSVHKALYLQVVTNSATVAYYGMDGLLRDGGTF